MEWLDAQHPEYVDRLAGPGRPGPDRDRRRRRSIEPILAMIPSRDRVGQIRAYTRWLERPPRGDGPRHVDARARLGAIATSATWSTAGIEYTVLDDFHFKNAGLTEDQLHGYYLTEDDGQLLSVFPGSERLRYMIPFAEPQETIDYLRQHRRAAPRRGGRLRRRRREVRHLARHQEARLRRTAGCERFFDALVANRDWIHVTTLAEARRQRRRRSGKIYLPDGSYREMTEWALPADAADRIRPTSVHEMEHDPPLAGAQAVRPRRLLAELQGEVPRSRRDVRADDEGQPPAGRRCDDGRARPARLIERGPDRALPRPVQLQLLARRVRRHLPAAPAQRRLPAPDRRRQPARPGDAGAPGSLGRGHGRRLQLRRPAGSAAGQRPADRRCWRRPRRADVRTRRPRDLPQPAGHADAPPRGLSPQGPRRRQQAATATAPASTTASSSSRKASTSGSSTTRYPRKSLLDHFYDDDVYARRGRRAARPPSAATSLDGAYEASVRRNPDRIQVQLIREGNGRGRAGADHQGRHARARAAHAGDRLPARRVCRRTGRCTSASSSTSPACPPAPTIATSTTATATASANSARSSISTTPKASAWSTSGSASTSACSSPGRRGIWTFPIETVSQSEGGFELVHQSVVVQPHWLVTADADGRWSVTIHCRWTPRRAEARNDRPAAAALS